jgi:RND superfamily putative drug exporter
VIKAAAVVMIGVFTSFALAGLLPVKEMGVVLAIGVLLDAVLVRLVLEPIVLRLLHGR